MSNIQKGKVYKVTHSRKGNFTAEIVADKGEWVDLALSDGEVKLLSRGAHIDKGDIFTVRKSFCTFAEV